MKQGSTQKKPAGKKFGRGSASIFLVFAALFWSYSFLGFCFGDVVLNVFGLPAWSNGSFQGTARITLSILPFDKTMGIHYTAFYSLFLFVPALILSLIYKDHLFTYTAKWLSLLFIVLLLISPVLYMI